MQVPLRCGCGWKACRTMNISVLFSYFALLPVLYYMKVTWEIYLAVEMVWLPLVRSRERLTGLLSGRQSCNKYRRELFTKSQEGSVLAQAAIVGVIIL